MTRRAAFCLFLTGVVLGSLLGVAFAVLAPSAYESVLLWRCARLRAGDPRIAVYADHAIVNGDEEVTMRFARDRRGRVWLDLSRAFVKACLTHHDQDCLQGLLAGLSADKTILRSTIASLSAQVRSATLAEKMEIVSWLSPGYTAVIKTNMAPIMELIDHEIELRSSPVLDERAPAEPGQPLR